MKRNKLNQAPNYKNKEIKVGTSDEWRTPPELFQKIQREFDLRVDRAATHENHLCDNYYTKEGHFYANKPLLHTISFSLEIEWIVPGFVNPPYSSPGVWFRKAHNELLRNKTLTVMLVKVATSEAYWSETVKDACVRFFAKDGGSGRLSFYDENNQPHYNANFSSALIIFSSEYVGNPKTEYWDYSGETPRKLF